MLPFHSLIPRIHEAIKHVDIVTLEQLHLELQPYEEAEARAMYHRIGGIVAGLGGSPEESRKQFHRSLELFEALGDVFGCARAHTDLGTAYQSSGMMDQALHHYLQGLDGFAGPDQEEQRGRVLSNLASLYAERGEIDLALSTFDRCIEIKQRYEDHLTLAGSLVAKANVLRRAAFFEQAIEAYQLAIEHAERVGSHRTISIAFTGLGSTYAQRGAYAQSLSMYRKGMAIAEELGDRRSVAIADGNIGGVYRDLGEYELSCTHYDRAIAVCQSHGWRMVEASFQTSIGSSYAMLEDLPAAIEHQQRAVDLYATAQSPMQLRQAQVNLALSLVLVGRVEESRTLVQSLGNPVWSSPSHHITHATILGHLDLHDGRMDEATSRFEQALQLAREHELRREEHLMHEALCTAAERRRDIDAYISHARAASRIRDELTGRATARRIGMLEAENAMEQERKEHEKRLAILHSTLPPFVADRVIRGERVLDIYENAAILFLDIEGFTTTASTVEAYSIVELLQSIFTSFDEYCSELDILKIKTIGDAYMAMASPGDGHIHRIAQCAMRMQRSTWVWPHSHAPVRFRIGLHCGRVVAGILGTDRLQYDVWGDTVNVASRMESSGEAGRIHTSASFAASLTSESAHMEHGIQHNSHAFHLVERGEIEIKGKGSMTTFWMEEES